MRALQGLVLGQLYVDGGLEGTTMWCVPPALYCGNDHLLSLIETFQFLVLARVTLGCMAFL